MANTIITSSTGAGEALFRLSGEFSATIKSSYDTGTGAVEDVSWDDSNYFYVREDTDKIIEIAADGNDDLTATINNSIALTAVSAVPTGLSVDDQGDFAVSDKGIDKLFVFSGFSTTTKSSQDITSYSTNPLSVSARNARSDVYWSSNVPSNKIYKHSGYIGSTLKTSTTISSYSGIHGVTWNGTDTITIIYGDRLLKTSGDLGSIIKASQDITGIGFGSENRGVETQDMASRMASYSPGGGGGPTFISRNVTVI